MSDPAGGDAELIAASLEEPECFAVLFDRHAPAIHQYVARRLGWDAADDVTAETFLTVFQVRPYRNSAMAPLRCLVRSGSCRGTAYGLGC
ncbi:hypothetical protein ABZ214_40390, partial [Streptomyces iakyrus]|uniref:RNA polymerase sigma factor n=1 Tax=Streptomyces iakyrus TaxID=68219 RepID=UPI00348E8826